MGNRYHKDRLHRFDNPQNRAMFLPMLCSRPSVKNVAVPRSGSFSDKAEPLSPKVGCMGQVKRRNGRVVGFPAPYKLNSSCGSNGAVKSNTCGSAKYSKLRRLFSGKSLTGSPASAVRTTTATVDVGAGRRRSVSKSGSFGSKVGNLKEAVDIGEMDPPLPVVRKVRKPEEAAEEGGGSLWRRRFGGVAPNLRSLEVQGSNPIRHQQLQLVTV